MRKLPKEVRRANQIAYERSEEGKATKKRWKESPNGRWKSARDAATAKKKKAKKNPDRYSWGLTFDEFVALDAQPCYYCNNFLGGKVIRCVGLDRIDPTKGYIPGNVLPCCSVCNKARNINFSVAEMKAAAEAIIVVRIREKEEEFWAANCEWWVEVGETPTSSGQ